MTKKDIEQFRQQLLALGKQLKSEFAKLEDAALRQAGGEAAGGYSARTLSDMFLMARVRDGSAARPVTRKTTSPGKSGGRAHRSWCSQSPRCSPITLTRMPQTRTDELRLSQLMRPIT